jgi:hypothetical protein
MSWPESRRKSQRLSWLPSRFQTCFQAGFQACFQAGFVADQAF